MLNWQKVVLSAVALVVVGGLVWHKDLEVATFLALFGGIVLPGPWSLKAPGDSDKTVQP